MKNRFIATGGVVVLCAVFSLGTLPILAQTATAEDVAEFRQVLAQINSLEPELSGYFLVRLAAETHEAGRKHEWLEEAIGRAGFAEPLDSIYIGRPTFSVAFALGGDRGGFEGLTVRLDAIEQLSQFDVSRAVAYLESTIPPTTVDLDCSSTLVPNIAKQYRRIHALTLRLFPQVKDGDIRRITYLTRLFSPAQSSLQLSPLLEFAGDPAFSEEEHHMLLTLLESALANLADGDPAYTAAMVTEDLSRRMTSFESALRKRGIGTLPLLQSYRAYLVRNAGRRCRDLLFQDRALLSVPGRSPIEAFNRLVRQRKNSPAGTPGHIAEIGPSEIRREERQAATEVDLPILQSPPSRVLAERLTRLSRQLEKGRSITAGASGDNLDRLIQDCHGYASTLPRDGGSTVSAIVESSHFYSWLLQVATDREDQLRVTVQFTSTLARLSGSRDVNLVVAIYLRRLLFGCWAPASLNGTEDLRTLRYDGARRGSVGASPTMTTLLELFARFSSTLAGCEAVTE